jgi:membrane-bound ClpP family serine protease
MHDQRASQIRTGLVLITIGVVFLIWELRVFPAGVARLWPWLLVALGIALLAVRGETEKRSGAWWLLFTGGLFVLHSHGVASVRDTWPLFIVATGVSVIAGGINRPSRKEP